MKKIAIAVSAVAALFLSACCGTLEKRSLEQIESNLRRQQTDHIMLMEKTKRHTDDKKDWEKHYEATFHLIQELKKSQE